VADNLVSAVQTPLEGVLGTSNSETAEQRRLKERGEMLADMVRRWADAEAAENEVVAMHQPPHPSPARALTLAPALAQRCACSLQFAASCVGYRHDLPPRRYIEKSTSGPRAGRGFPLVTRGIAEQHCWPSISFEPGRGQAGQRHSMMRLVSIAPSSLNNTCQLQLLNTCP